MTLRMLFIAEYRQSTNKTLQFNSNLVLVLSTEYTQLHNFGQKEYTLTLTQTIWHSLLARNSHIKNICHTNNFLRYFIQSTFITSI